MIIRPAEEHDIPAITAIYNEIVANSTAVWTEKPDTEAERLSWLTARRTLGYPVLVAADNSAILGYGSFGDFRAWPGYRYSVEHSIHVDAKQRRQGIGRLLVNELIRSAAALGKHALIAGIDGSNDASVALHARAGFTEVARMPEVGRKFGRWLDLVFMQLMLDEPGAMRAD